MAEQLQYHRWRMSVPEASEDALSDWLLGAGASAFYREADPPFEFIAYFPPGTKTPEVAGLGAFEDAVLLAEEAFGDEDWLAKSREGFGPIEVGHRFYIRPLWDEPDELPVPEGRIPVVINPGLAFGTGGHETTRLCMELLEGLAQAGRLEGPLVDVGAGTGILSLAAHLLGAQDILAFDNDPDCGPAMEELIAMNVGVLGGRRPYDHFVGLLDDPRILAKAPFQGMLANIILETIRELLPQMARTVAPGGWLIASGILAERQDEALVALAAEGFKPLVVRNEGQWMAILAERM